MATATFRFYAELNDFLPVERRGVSFDHEFSGRPAVKDVVEALGVPHPEIALLIADGEPVDLGWRLVDRARVGVYPEFDAIDVACLPGVRRPAPVELRFVLDGHLGRLARYLRMAGIDAWWERQAGDAALARLSAETGRILVTRDVGLLKRREVTHGHWVRSTDPALQLRELSRRFHLAAHLAPFHRCLRCNTVLDALEKSAIYERLPPRVRERHERFRGCPSCGRIYWAGTHVGRMEQLLELLRD